MLRTDSIDSDSRLAIESPEFALRFGSLLTTTRRRSKRSIRDLAASSLVGFDASQLKRFERGSVTVDESVVAALCLAYSADIGQILPQRLPVAISDGRLSAGGVSVGFSTNDPKSLMVSYLRLIGKMRNQRMSTAIELRRDDILAIALYLDVDGAAVVERLATLMNATPAQRNTMAMLFATGAIVIALAAGGQAAVAGTDPIVVTNPVAGNTSGASEPVGIESQFDPALQRDNVVIPDGTTVEFAPLVTEPVAGAVTSPVTVPMAAPVVETTTTIAAVDEVLSVEVTPTTAEAAQAPQVEPELLATASLTAETAAAAAPVDGFDRGAATAGLSTATRLLVPVASPPLTVAAEAPTPNRSNCNPDPSDAVMKVVIPDIVYSCPVYAGGQSMIDAGFVTLVTDAGVNPVLATRPGDPGTLWLAGHRTTHGAAFADVPNLADGALVTVSSGNASATYRVVGRSYVEVSDGRVIDASGQATAAATWASIIRSDFGGDLVPRLVLQTCEGADFRWMIYADLVTG